MSKNNIDLSVVIVSSKLDFLSDCVKGLNSSLSKINNEIIIVDNASVDKVGSQIKKQFPNVKIIRREINGGFGENNNMGMKIATGRYVLLLNDDTKIIQKNIFHEMISWMDEHVDVGIASCALVNPDEKTIQGSGGYFPTLPRVLAWMTFVDDIPGVDKIMKPYHPLHPGSPFYKNEGYYMKSQQQDWVTGAFFLMRKEAMDQAGIFDEDFFLYVEEVELAYRFMLKGWKSWYLPRWKIVHYGQTTNGSEKATIFEMQNLKLFYKKHYPSWQLPFLTLTLKFGALLRMMFYALVNLKVAKIYAKAFSAI